MKKMVFKLWLMMMSLVVLATVFMWMVGVWLFEKNYTRESMKEAAQRLEPVMETLQNGRYSEDDQFLPFLSRVMNGYLFLLDGNGKLVGSYSYGYQSDNGKIEPEWDFYTQSRTEETSKNILNRTPYQRVVNMKDQRVWIECGIPVIYEGEDSYLTTVQIQDLSTILDMNQTQSARLGLILTVSAALLAAVFSRHFTKPIYQIKAAVDSLAKNDYSAKPNVRRKDELGELAGSVEILGKELSRVDVMGKELIANVSHELKTPLSLIAGYGEMVRDIDWKEDEAREEDLDLIIREARRMGEMVNDILDYSCMQAGALELHKESLDFCSLAKTEVFQCTAAAAEHGIRLEFESEREEILLEADGLKLSQVLRNLLYNAVNHTPDGGVIGIHLEVLGETLRFSVSNPGDPIPEEERRVIWQRYQRSQHQNGRNLGTGIGLSIVSTILEAHHMTYGVDCHDGQTIFWFEARESF